MYSIEAIRNNAGRFTLLGIVQIILGVVALGAPFATGTAVTMVVGAILLLAGLAQIIQGVRATSLGSTLIPLIGGIIAALCGALVLAHPLLGLGFLTLLLAGFFFAEGIWKIAFALRLDAATGRNWMLFGGIIAVILGILIWRQWPLSGAWAIGTLVGIDLLLGGSALVAVALAARTARTTGDTA
jgi:uncharacterized membrane protein HdeD (DUF308 family)